MSKDKYLIDNGSKLFTVLANHVPQDPKYQKVLLIPDGLLSEDERWLQIEQVDVDGVMTDVVTVDTPTKTTVQQQDLDEQLARANAEAAKETEKNDLKDKVDKTKKRKIDTLDEIKAEIQNIYDALDYIMGKM